jgi:hypothetical protein
MTGIDLATLSDAIVVWTGWDDQTWPDRDDQRVITKYGAELGPLLLDAARTLMHDFYSSDAKDTVAGLVEMGDQAATEFRARNPEVSERAVQAMRWCYTFDNR